MAQQVRAFGQVLQFPDGMSDSDMAKAIQDNEHVLNPDFKQPEGFSGAAKNIVSGTKQTGRMMGAGFDTIRNKLSGVEEYAKSSDIARQQETPVEQRKLLGELSGIDREQGALGQIGDTLSAAGRNPMGTAQMIVEQLPNTAVSLGGGYTGFKAGALAGSVLGPVGATVGGTLGFLGGMFLGNMLLETGSKAIEKASDEDGYTPEDRDTALREGAVKGAVITGVDAATLKLGSMVTNRLGAGAVNAGAKAEAKVLMDAGVDMTSTATINAALKSSPEIMKQAKLAGEKAAIQSLSRSRKAGIVGTGLALETAGEGVGEYAGEIAATGKGDVVDATIEALSSATQSLAETAYNFNKLKAGNDLSPEGIRKVADGVNEMTLKEGLGNISKSKSVDEAINAAVVTVTTDPVTNDDVLKTVEPSLLDIERLTGLKPTEAIEQINQGEQNAQSQASQETEQKTNEKPVPVLGNDTGALETLADSYSANTNNLSHLGHRDPGIPEGNNLGNIDSFSGEHSLGGDSLGLKETRNGFSIHANSISDLTNSKPFIDKGFDGLDIDDRRRMVSSVVAMAHDDKVRDIVISSIPVDMMNMLRSKKLSPDVLLHDPSMLFDANSIINSDIPVSRRVDVTGSFAKSVASYATKNSLAVFDRGQRSVDSSAAMTTIDNRHDITPNSDVVTGALDVDASSVPPIISKESANKQEGVLPSQTLKRTASWVIKEKSSGKVILETFDKKKVDALNTDKYEAVPILAHLQSLNGKNGDVQNDEQSKLVTDDGFVLQQQKQGSSKSNGLSDDKSSSRTPEERLKDRERAKQLERKLNDQGHEFRIVPKDVRDFTAGDRGKEDEADAAEKIAKIFGRRVVWIDAQGKHKINGVIITTIKDVIYLDIKSDHAAHAVMGHELSHHLQHDNPNLYKELVQSLKTVIKDQDKYAWTRGLTGAKDSDITEEIIGDIMGDNFTKQEFWNRVAEANPGVFKKIADTIIAWLKKLTTNAKMRGLGSEQWVTDAKKAQDILVDAIAKYTDQPGSSASDKAKFHSNISESNASALQSVRNKLVADSKSSFFNDQDVEITAKFSRAASDEKNKQTFSEKVDAYKELFKKFDDNEFIKNVDLKSWKKLHKDLNSIRDDISGALESGIIDGIDAGGKKFLSRNTTDSGNPWRITYFNNYEPNGHSEYTSARKAVDDILIGTLKGKFTALSEDDTAKFSLASQDGNVIRKSPYPVNAGEPIFAFKNTERLKLHKDYQKAKSGDYESADRLVSDLIPNENIAEAKDKFGEDVVYVPVVLKEQSGTNRIPHAMAVLYASKNNSSISTSIYEVDKAYHTGMKMMERLVSRAVFDGTVERGAKYVLVDDVTTTGATLADLSSFIQGNGGIVVGSVLLTNAMRTGSIHSSPKTIQRLEVQHGNAIRELFGIEPQSLTKEESQYLIGFRTDDELRNSAAKARDSRSERILLKKASKPEDSVKFSKKTIDERLIPLSKRNKSKATSKDAEYMTAVENGDLDKAQKMVDQVARDKGYISGSDYRMMHKAPNREDYNLSAIKDTGIVPDDYWTHPHYYQSESTERDSFRIINSAISRQERTGKNNSGITIYRSVPKDVKDDHVRNGDWVTPSREYAKMEGEGIPGGYRIITGHALLKNLWWDANSINELGYDDGKEYAYKNTKNNRKLIDPVTYDDDGNIIPLSKRFNSRTDDIRFSRASIPDTINIDGTDRPTRNSNGQLIHPTEEGIGNFWRWFSGSKVTDDAGRPIVVYHGSPDLRFINEDGTFKSEKARYGFGKSDASHWFTTDISTAKSYADPKRAFDYQNAEEGIVETYIKILDPLTISAQGSEWRSAQKRGQTSDVIGQAKSEGNDGVIIKSVKDNYNNDSRTKPTTTFTVFESNQIKSALGNTGEFSSDNDDIRFSRRIHGDEPNNDDYVVPETPEFEGNMTGDLAYTPAIAIDKGIEQLPIRLRVGVAKGLHSGYGIEHIADNEKYDSQRKPPQYTDDRAENYSRHIAELAKSFTEIYSDGNRKILRSGKLSEALVIQKRNDGDDRFYSVVTWMPLKGDTAIRRFGKPDWVERGRFSNDRLLQPRASVHPIDQTSQRSTMEPQRNQSNSNVQSQGRSIFPDDGLLQSSVSSKTSDQDSQRSELQWRRNQTSKFHLTADKSKNQEKSKPEITIKKRRIYKQTDGDDGPKFSLATERPVEKDDLNAIPEETTFRKAQRLTQDAFNRFTVIKDWLKDRGVELSEKANVYAAEERYHSRVANQLEDFREKIRNPLIEKIAKAGFTLSDVSDYLEAQHAKEANASIQKLIDDPDATAYGITDKEAEDYLKNASPELAKLSNELRDITEQSKQLRLKNGLLSQEEIDAWEAAYKHYIPVKGDSEANKGTGKGLKVNFKTKRRLGHGRRDEAVIENILMDHERAIMQVEKNRVAKHLVMMAAEIGMPELMTIGQPEKRKVLKNTTAFEVQVKGVTHGVFDTREAANMFKKLIPATNKNVATGDIVIVPTTDQRVVAMSSQMLADNEANAYFDGHAIRVQINDELLARAYGKLGVTGFSAIVNAGRMLNGYLSKVYTGYNPEFIITNLIRDFTSGVINLTGEQGIKMAAKTVGNYGKSFASLLKYAATGESNTWIDRYRNTGGNTGAAYLSDLERLGDEVKTEFASYQGVISNLKQKDFANASRAAGRKVFNKTLKWIYVLNQAGENAMRLSAFRAMIESGESPLKAASVAKNITVNFNRKGEFGAEANAAYLFFNASVQGTAAIAHALTKGEHKYEAWALSGGMVTLGYLAAAALAGGDEDEYDRVNDYTKERNLLIKSGDGFVQIPVPYGYGFFWNLGRSIADAQRKGEMGKLPWHIASSAIEELTPFSDTVVGNDGEFQSDQVLLGLAPTVFKIPAQPILNKQLFSGGELMPDSPFKQFQPDREKMWRATQGTMFDHVAGWLETGLGMDVSPETLKHYTRTLTGGAGNMVDTSISAGLLKAQGAELETSEIPFYRKAYTELTIRDHRSAFYKASEEAKKAAEEFSRAKEKNDLGLMQKVLDDKKELLALNKYASKLQKVIGVVRDEQDAIRMSDTLTAAEKRLRIKESEMREEKLYNQYLDVFKTKQAGN